MVLALMAGPAVAEVLDQLIGSKWSAVPPEGELVAWFLILLGPGLVCLAAQG